MQFYARFQDEVVADPALIAAHVERAREQISPAFRLIFDEALVEAHHGSSPTPPMRRQRSASSPSTTRSSRETLGLTTFNFVSGYLDREGLLSGFVAGYSKIHHDEQRHIGYGTWFLREAVAAEPALLRRCGRPCANCCRRWPSLSLRPPVRRPTGVPSASTPRRSATSHSAG